MAISPDSSLFISRTSFTRSNKKPEADIILSRHSSSFSLLPRLNLHISTIPLIPLIGVLISWLIRLKKSVFAILARFSCSAACRSCLLYSISCSCILLSSLAITSCLTNITTPITAIYTNNAAATALFLKAYTCLSAKNAYIV